MDIIGNFIEGDTYKFITNFLMTSVGDEEYRKESFESKEYVGCPYMTYLIMEYSLEFLTPFLYLYSKIAILSNLEDARLSVKVTDDYLRVRELTEEELGKENYEILRRALVIEDFNVNMNFVIHLYKSQLQMSSISKTLELKVIKNLGSFLIPIYIEMKGLPNPVADNRIGLTRNDLVSEEGVMVLKINPKPESNSLVYYMNVKVFSKFIGLKSILVNKDNFELVLRSMYGLIIRDSIKFFNIGQRLFYNKTLDVYKRLAQITKDEKDGFEERRLFDNEIRKINLKDTAFISTISYFNFQTHFIKNLLETKTITGTLFNKEIRSDIRYEFIEDGVLDKDGFVTGVSQKETYDSEELTNIFRGDSDGNNTI